MRFESTRVLLGLVGLAISYALSITGLLNGVLTSFTETEKQMVAVERVQQYTEDIPEEKLKSVRNVPANWPMQGVVSFRGVSLRYRDNLPLALNDVSFDTTAGEKLGVCGRTGSGKSSLFQALFRMTEIQSGSILIDGMNLYHMPLDDMRRRLAIIPQDPFLFSGSIRFNLDPTSEFSDADLHSAIHCCHLRDLTEKMGGLDAEVGERGRRLSVGQRQLLCLGRALLRRARVLCIDEATAAVDDVTDRLIQQTIRTEFAGSTVITIAHRVASVMDCDRVLVMHSGSVAELAPPAELLADSESRFYGFVHGAGSLPGGASSRP